MSSMIEEAEKPVKIHEIADHPEPTYAGWPSLGSLMEFSAAGWSSSHELSSTEHAMVAAAFEQHENEAIQRPS